MPISDELARARALAHAADEEAARDLLLSLIPAITTADRDDLMLEVLAQLGDIYLERGAYSGVAECRTRIRDCLGVYSGIVAGTMPQAAAQVSLPATEMESMIARYAVRADLLDIGLAAAGGEHDRAHSQLQRMIAAGAPRELITDARIRCATGLCEDDLYTQATPMWQAVTAALDGTDGDDGAPGAQSDDHRFIAGALGYGRYCVQTGRLDQAQPWLRRAAARADRNGWELATARTQLERAAACWAAGDQAGAETLTRAAYPAIARHARAHDVSRCWLYLGLSGLAVGELDYADECFGHAERHWRELGKPLHIHRILLQRSWINIFRGEFDAATELVAQAREYLDAAPRHSWLQYARLDDHLGTIRRAAALAEPDPAAAAPEFAAAAELKVPAALAVDAVRYAIAEPEARMRWATHVSAPMLAGAFAVGWECGDPKLLSELIEYHTARGSLTARAAPAHRDGWAAAATAAVPADPPATLDPLPPLVMQPGGVAVLGRYRALAFEKYGQQVTAEEPAWATWQ